MITHTISVTELVWTLFCAIGLFYNARILVRAVADLFEVRVKKINSLREYAARLTVFVYLILSFVQFAFVLVGVIAMFLPPAQRGQPVNPFQVAVSIVFIIVSAIMAIGAFINEYGRRQLVAKIAELEEF